MAAKQIILLASERSGTNLLRAIASTHPDIASPPPCGVVNLLAKRAYKYLMPTHPNHLDALIEDAILATQTHLNKWDITLDRQDIRQRMPTPSFWGLFQALNEIYAGQKGCTSWLSKEPNLFVYIYEIVLHMPNARFIYLVRDGRDVATSMLRGGVHEHHIYHAAHHWAADQRACLTALSDPLLRNRAFMLKYEDLIAKPETCITQLMGFLGMHFDASQLEFYKSDTVLKHAQSSEFWKNLSKPIDAANHGGYRRELQPREIEIFESVAKQEMQLLGYALDHTRHRHISRFDRCKFMLSAYCSRMRTRRSNREEAKRRLERNRALQTIINRTFHDDD